MLFNSLGFAAFFPAVTALYFLLQPKYRNLMLLVASCIFYMAFIPRYILILVFTILVDYLAGLLIERLHNPSKRKLCLVLSLVANIGVLALFKYINFISQNMSFVLGQLGISGESPVVSIILPIGLSFHTFQAMSYTIEVYRGAQKAERNFLIYALYVMFYPQLVAGPIERPQNLLHQFRAVHRFEYERVVEGLRLMLWGFFKKLVIADRLAVVVNNVYGNPERIHGPAMWIAVYFFTFQIYCDFSGYSDIARGAARVMGFELMKNFNLPYFASSLRDFWRRWHISLSTWFKDYLYSPLGGNRLGRCRQAMNLIIVFAVCGLWHGANWTFVVWGLIHGCALAATQGLRLPTLPGVLSVFITFHVTVIAWVFFRSSNFQDVTIVISNLFDWRGALTLKNIASLGVGYFEVLFSACLIGTLMIVESVELRTNWIQGFLLSHSRIRWSVYYAALAIILLFGKFTESQFIYFQF